MDESMRAVELAVVELVRASRRGLPDGELYVELQAAFGPAWTLAVHRSVVDSLVTRGSLRRARHILAAVETAATETR